MRKVTFGGANSLDNYVARKDHAVDWLLWSDEAAAVMADQPVLLGSGIPLFHEMSRQITLQLLEGKAFKNGCAFVKYRVMS